MEKIQKPIIIIGPTSSGKTSLALDLCRKYGGEIISADSRQIYKYMDIGTGKIPVEENLKYERKEDHWLIDGVKIWGYDLINPNEIFSAYNFKVFAQDKIKKIMDSGKKVFVIGGTGFYINVLLGNVPVSNIPPNQKLREELQNMSTANLKAKLKGLNLPEYNTIDLNNRIRLIRAIEKSSSTKKSQKERPDTFPSKLIGLAASREVFYSRVDRWLDEIWGEDLMEEVNFLLSHYCESDKLNGLVYRSAVSYLKGETFEKEAKQRAKYDLHAYIRRQQTYFKKMKDVNWVDIAQDNYREKLYNMLDG